MNIKEKHFQAGAHFYSYLHSYSVGNWHRRRVSTYNLPFCFKIQDKYQIDRVYLKHGSTSAELIHVITVNLQLHQDWKVNLKTVF